MIGIRDIERLADVAQLELTAAEKEACAVELNNILQRVKKIQQLETRNVTPTTHALPLQNVLREDRVGQHLRTEQALANAGATQDNFFKVPRII